MNSRDLELLELAVLRARDQFVTLDEKGFRAPTVAYTTLDILARELNRLVRETKEKERDNTASGVSARWPLG